jgi:hypothetical protein
MRRTTFRIEDDPSLGSSTAGRFEITKFNGSTDFSEGKVELNFGVIKGISSTTTGDFDSSFQKYAGLFGKNGFVLRRVMRRHDTYFPRFSFVVSLRT